MNKEHAGPVAAAYIGKSRRLARAAIWLLASTVITAPAWSNPQGGQIVGGQGTITNPSANTTLINQRSSNLLVNWSSFNVAANQTVQFQQPSASAAALN